VTARWITFLVAIVATGCAVVKPSRPGGPSGPSAPSGSGDSFGLAGPVLIQAASFKWRWVAACFASRDTDDDGSVRILVGRHGDASGDESRPYLMLRGAGTEPIEQFVGSSRGGRLLAIVEHDLWLVDAERIQRWNLSALGARIPSDGSPVLPHPAVSFSADGRVAFVRKASDGLELVVFDPRTGQQTIVFSTHEEIARFNFEGTAFQVRTLRSGAADNSIYTNLAARACRSATGSYLTFRTGSDPTRLATIPLPTSTAQSETDERVLVAYHECTLDGLPAVASSADKTQHLLASSLDGYFAERGPLRWSHAQVHRNNCADEAPR
jgi:hypothetical protein